MPPKPKVSPEISDETCDHKTIVKDRQPNQQPIKNVVQMGVLTSKNSKIIGVNSCITVITINRDVNFIRRVRPSSN